MKRIKFLGLFAVLLLIAGFLLSACGNAEDDAISADNAEKKVIKIGASADAVPLVESGIEVMKTMGYEVEVVPFDDFFVPNVSLDEGSIDANFYQHKVFMDKYNKENSTNIVMLDPSMYNYFLGFYSKKATTVEGLPEGGKIGIANDAANIDQFLRVMDKWGIIGLTDEEKDLYTVADIVDNPKNFEFVQLDYNQRVAAFDELAGMVCASNTAFMAGMNPRENLMFTEVDNDYALGLCINANTDSADEQWVKDLMSAYTSDEAYQYVLEYYKGAYEKSEALQALAK